jgi:hypothetical protein
MAVFCGQVAAGADTATRGDGDIQQAAGSGQQAEQSSSRFKVQGFKLDRCQNIKLRTLDFEPQAAGRSALGMRTQVSGQYLE